MGKVPMPDFIPEGQDTGGYGRGGFRDWIPAPEPVKEEQKEDKKEEKSE